MRNFTIAAGANTSTEGVLFGEDFNNESGRYLAVRLKTGSWTSASVGVKVSFDGGTTYLPVRIAGSYTAIANIASTVWDYIVFPAPAGARIKLWSHNGSGTPTTQVTEVVLEAMYI